MICLDSDRHVSRKRQFNESSAWVKVLSLCNYTSLNLVILHPNRTKNIPPKCRSLPNSIQLMNWVERLSDDLLVKWLG